MAIDFKSLSAEQKDVAKKVMTEAELQGIDPSLALAIAYSESRFKHYSGVDKEGKPKLNLSSTGAIGALQTEPATVDAYNKKFDMKLDPKNLDDNIKAGVFILKDNLEHYGNPLDAVVAYNTSVATRNKFFDSRKLTDLPVATRKYLSEINDNHPLEKIDATNLMKQDEYIPEAQKMMEEESNVDNVPEVKKIDGSDIAVNYGLNTLGQTFKNPLVAGAGLASGIAQQQLLKPNPIDVLKAQENLAGKGTIKVHETGPLYGTSDEAGRTGRSRQSYNDITSIRAQQAKAQMARLQELLRRGIISQEQFDKFVSEAAVGESSPSGILHKSLDADTKAALEEEFNAGKRGMFSRATKGITKPITMLNRLSARFPKITNTLSALNAAESAELAKRRMEAGQYGGAALSGLNTIASGAAALPLSVNPIVDIIKGAGMTGEMLGLPAELAYEYATGNTPDSYSVVKEYEKAKDKVKDATKKAVGKAKGGSVKTIEIQTAIPLDLRHVYYHRHKRSFKKKS